MIKEIIEYTQVTKESDSLLNFNQDLSFLQNLDYENHIEERQSFRYFDSNKNLLVKKMEVQNILDSLVKISEKVLKIPQAIEFCIVDNKGFIGKSKSKIYQYKNKNFQEIILKNPLNRDNLYIQEEMHDCDGVIFFLWDFSKIPANYSKNGRFYKEIIMMSGLLGQIISEYAEFFSWKGTLFAGIMEADWRAIVADEHSLKKPIFAYAFQKFIE